MDTTCIIQKSTLKNVINKTDVPSTVVVVYLRSLHNSDAIISTKTKRKERVGSGSFKLIQWTMQTKRSIANSR